MLTFFQFNKKINFSFLNTDEPDRPGKPYAKDWDKNSVHLKWTPPANENGAPVTSYIIEKKDQYR